MNLMDWVQIALLIVFILLILKPVWQQWLPRRWNGLLNRLLPARALKSEGYWQRQSPKTDAKINEK
ncbi:cellulose biosynthesis protein BcsF [Pantoea sp. GD03673]|uniref:cellulose biosynthesis protein BcsF n=1 Tax=Pantoea sp. GD03673 TaxID=2975364 RepID=UPI0024487577|nr:cellulose biosynthesis protein BcsF [Pantoea sp. GD03673]MDH2068838.1 cellulose biosynthesis protein BcsF [Pantoea sp. GD03673]